MIYATLDARHLSNREWYRSLGCMLAMRDGCCSVRLHITASYSAMRIVQPLECCTMLCLYSLEMQGTDASSTGLSFGEDAKAVAGM